MQRFFSHTDLAFESRCDGKQDATLWSVCGKWIWNPDIGFASWIGYKWEH
jgi:hypothetical protein